MQGWRAAHVALALAWIGLALLAYLAFRIVEPFLNPLGWAAVMAIVFYPVYARLERRWGPSWAAAVSTVAVTVVVIVPLLFVMTAFVREALQAAGDLQQGFVDGHFAQVDRVWNWLIQHVPGMQRADVAAVATDAARRGAMFLAGQLGAVARNTAGFLFDLVLALFATFFLLRDSTQIVATIRRLLPMDGPTGERLIAHTSELVSISVTSAVVVAAAQGFLGGLVFAGLGIDAPVFWGVVMGFFCLLPFGAWVIWLPAAILLALSGQVGRAVILAGLGFGIVSAADNILRPMLLSGRTSMNGLLILVSLLGGMAAFGALGLVLGPLVIATGLALLTTYVEALPPPASFLDGPP